MAERLITHKQAVDIVRRYAGREWGEIVYSVEKGIPGLRVMPDVVTYWEKKGKRTYTICEIKTDRSDLQRAFFQLEMAKEGLLKEGAVNCFVAVTRYLMADMDKAQWDDFVNSLKRKGYGLLVVFSTKVELRVPALIEER